jgi:ribosomal protein L37AE/L43A
MEFKDLMQAKSQGVIRTEDNRPKFFRCEACGKTIVQRKENGLWYFSFGKMKNEEGKFVSESPVEIFVYGSIRIKCWRKECFHWNTFNFYPFKFFESETEEKLAMPTNK